MPGIFRYGINHLKEHLNLLILKGLSSILMFGVIETLEKVKKGLNIICSKKISRTFRHKILF